MYLIIHTTTSTPEEAKKIASYLVENKLAACVNMHSISSVYSWNGKTEEDHEIALSIKTTSENLDAVSEAIKSMHSYELPAIIYWEIDGDKDYLKWISDSTIKK
ncbi:divalent-cation tolerance protein CutA [Methanolobus sp. ZRKC3]|uniref:divalent-cation tolerance protein CutA n=1 Tax=Methanolobus sp. ZRKC3 TaxID=3125786 RepID=UPI003255C91B